MKELILARHAKSTWKDKDIEDIDRPLKPSGIEEAYQMARMLVEHDCYPDMILSSAANRSIHTALIYSRLLKYASRKISIDFNLYLPSIKKLFSIIRDLPDNKKSVMLVGHEPSLSGFVNEVVEKNSTIEKIPTSGIICLSFPCKYFAVRAAVSHRA